MSCETRDLGAKPNKTTSATLYGAASRLATNKVPAEAVAFIDKLMMREFISWVAKARGEATIYTDESLAYRGLQNQSRCATA